MKYAKMREDLWLEAAVSLLENSKDEVEAEGNIGVILVDYRIQKVDFQPFHMLLFGKLGLEFLRVCFKFRIKNSRLVAEVLHFARFTTLRTISIIHVLGQIVPSTLATNSRALEYFLDRSNEARLLFSGHRIQDSRNTLNTTPIVLAANACDVKCVEILLRYGCELPLHVSSNDRARLPLTQEACDDSYSYNYYCDFALIREIRNLFCLLYRTLCVRPGYDIDENIPKFVDCQMKDKQRDILIILNLFLRSVTHIQIDVFKTMIVVLARIPIAVQISAEFFMKLSDRGYLPTLEERLKTPAALKHLCRCSIRRALHRAWNLPHGIRKLQLPHILWRYLDLDED